MRPEVLGRTFALHCGGVRLGEEAGRFGCQGMRVVVPDHGTGPSNRQPCGGSLLGHDRQRSREGIQHLDRQASRRPAGHPGDVRGRVNLHASAFRAQRTKIDRLLDATNARGAPGGRDIGSGGDEEPCARNDATQLR